MRDAQTVEAPGRDVGRHHDAASPLAEVGQGLLSLVLGQIALQRRGLPAHVSELEGQGLGPVLRPGENEHRLVLSLTKKGVDELDLAGAGNVVDVLVDAGDRNRVGHFDQNRVAQFARGELVHFWRHGGREQQRLAIAGKHGHDLAQVAQKAHVEHPVRLVHHQGLHPREIDQLLVEQVQQPAWTRHGHRRTGQGLDLRVLGDAAVRYGAAHADLATEAKESLVNLQGQLAGGRQHEHADGAAPGRVSLE